jgi:NADH-quinone oxidoreductase subunit N
VNLDYSSAGHYLIVLLPETVLTLGAFVVLLLDVFQRGRDPGPSGAWTGQAAVASVLAAAAASLWVGLNVEASSGLVAVDDFRLAASLVLLGGTLLALLFAFDYGRREGLHIGEFYALVLLATVGMLVLVGARDLVLVFLGLELMSIAVYVLTGFNRNDPRSAEAGLKYFLVGAFASAFILYGIALLYGATGSTNIPDVMGRVAASVEEGSVLFFSGVTLLLIGFGYKIAAVPFHMWTPDAYEGAPTSVTGYMAVGVKAAAFVALLRVFTGQLAPAAEFWSGIVWWLAMLTMIVPNLIALVQNNVKRMLAYSSVAHAGYLLVGVATGTAFGRAAALFYLAAYTLMTLGAFAVVYAVAGKGDRRMTLADFRGLGWRRPGLAFALLLFLLSLAGFPPTGGFVGKLYLLRASIDAGQVALAVTLVLSSLISYYYYLRVVWKMYFEEGTEHPVAKGGFAFRFSTAICAGGILTLGLLPGPALRAFERAGADLESAPTAEVSAEGSSDTSLPGERANPASTVGP